MITISMFGEVFLFFHWMHLENQSYVFEQESGQISFYGSDWVTSLALNLALLKNV